MPLVPVVLLLRKMVQPLAQPTDAANAVQAMFPRPFHIGPVRDGT